MARKPVVETTSISPRSTKLLIVLGLVALVIIIYLPSARFGYVDWDDGDYAAENQKVQQGLSIDGVREAFTTTKANNWHPLTWLSLMLDVSVFGDHAWGHHVMNIALHAANAVLLVVLLWMSTAALWRSAFVAALLASHPMHVESVAWVSERKDVLSLLFWLLTMLAYLHYARRRSLIRYLLVVACFALGLLAKQMIVTLPVILLLWDLWPLQRASLRFGKLDLGLKPESANRPSIVFILLEKLPLLALCAAAAIVILSIQHTDVQLSEGVWISLPQRLENVIIGYVLYLGKLFWPVDLAAMYPNYSLLGIEMWSAWQTIGASVLLLAITAMSLWLWRRVPALAVGWLWFLITLTPVSGIVQIGRQHIADRYAYIPFIGLYIALIWLLSEMLKRFAPRAGQSLAAAGAPIIIGALAFAAHEQVSFWHDGVTLFKRAVAVTDRNWLAHGNLGTSLEKKGRLADALPHYRAATDYCPQCGWAYAQYGKALLLAGQLDEAKIAIERALAINPHDARSAMNLGAVFFMQTDVDKAVELMRRGLELDPKSAEGHENLAVALMALGQNDEAASELETAIRLSPNPPERWRTLVTQLRSGLTVAPPSSAPSAPPATRP